jgi:hypothetical protein
MVLTDASRALAGLDVLLQAAAAFAGCTCCLCCAVPHVRPAAALVLL